MKKYLSLFVIVLLFACLVGCQSASIKSGENSEVSEISATEPMDTEQIPSATKPKPQKEMDQDALVKVVAKNLGVPDGMGYVYEVDDLFYWDAGEIWYRRVTVYVDDGAVAGAAVDPTNGDLLRLIMMYEKPE